MSTSNKLPLKVGDRVAVYGPAEKQGNPEGHTYLRGDYCTVEGVHFDDEINVLDVAGHLLTVHPFQCRRLIKRPKLRSELPESLKFCSEDFKRIVHFVGEIGAEKIAELANSVLEDRLGEVHRVFKWAGYSNTWWGDETNDGSDEALLVCVRKRDGTK